MRAKYIAFDCETTGLDLEKAELLSVYFRFLTKKFETVGELELFCKPEGQYYQVDPGGMAINKIDLVKHHQRAISYTEAGYQLKETIRSFLDEEEIIELLTKGILPERLEPIGHFYTFDEAFCKRKLLPEWDSYVLRSGLDTKSISNFMKFTGQIPPHVSTSLPILANYFNIPNQGAHDAKFDTNMTIEVLKCLKNLTLSL